MVAPRIRNNLFSFQILKLPANPNVVAILEGYYKQYGIGQICNVADKSTTRHRNNITNPRANHNHIKLKPEDVQKR